MTERRAVSPYGAMLTGPTELAVDVPSCNGDPVVDELVEDDEQVSIRVVATMVVSGASPSCSDALPVTLEEPLGERTLIDLVSGETLTVVEPITEPDAPQTERRPVTPVDVGLASPTELSVTIPSCGGNPVVDELEEDDEQVRIRIVTTVADSGDDCLDGLGIVLDDPLDGRTVIDLVSGETLTVALFPDVGSDSESCVESRIEFDEEPLGQDTVDEAVEEFAANDDFLADVTFDDERIIYQGEVVGKVVVSSTSEGGYIVTRAQWCYPDDY
ncbi:MAG: hypothetical protein EA388_09175 [Nitriliruptor sp.]|nr:MAG: hypothetical protein EA388_09175 [Nitriliruptor sp.]